MTQEQLDWEALARDICSTNQYEERGGSEYAQQALGLIIGEQNTYNAVRLIITWQPGSGLARSVLRYIHSVRAMEIAYQEYKTGNKEYAASAVGLIKDICHPRALDWVYEFLRDDEVAIWGIGIIDQLIWSNTIKWDDPRVASLLEVAKSHHDENVRRQAEFIQEYVSKDNDRKR